MIDHRRRPTRRVHVGTIPLGDGAPITVQSMTNTDTRNTVATLEQVFALYAAGAQIVRLGIPDDASAQALERIVQDSPVPLVADIHYDYRLALTSVKAGAAKLRINPGNLPKRYVATVAEAAGARGIPIRIGVNAGSLPADIRRNLGSGPDALVEAALRQVRLLEGVGFFDIVISLKAADVGTTVRANELLAEQSPYPIHLGVTEAGTPEKGTIRSSVGIGYLLGRGIGDTLRVSLTGDPVKEVEVGREILRAWNLAPQGIRIVSCPTCARCQVDLPRIALGVEEAVRDVKGDLTVAVMGCEVNGPAEARAADVGVCCGPRGGVLIRGGQVIRRIDEDEMVSVLVDEIMQLLDPDA